MYNKPHNLWDGDSSVCRYKYWQKKNVKVIKFNDEIHHKKFKIHSLDYPKT